MANKAWWLLLALLLALLLSGLAQAAAPRIGVMTMQPGEIFWERFGHDAIVVADPATGEALSYNYGFFDPGEPGFLGRFVRGEMQYMLVALPLAQDLAIYREEGRGVSIQWLDLDDGQATALAESLAIAARPENARYRYDYFTENCATKVRDAIDAALGGRLHQQIAGRSRGNTYRSEAVRLASPATLMWLGFDIGLSRHADRQLSRWEEAFVPMRLADSLGETVLEDGRPLVRATEQLLPHRLPPEPAEAPRPWWPWLLAGLAVAAALVLVARTRPRLFAALAGMFWLGSGLLGLLMLYLWFGTEHRFAWGNENLLLFDPLALALLPGAWQRMGGRMPSPWFDRLLRVVVFMAVAAWLLKWVALSSQVNAPWIALLLPVHVAWWLGFRRPR